MAEKYVWVLSDSDKYRNALTRKQAQQITDMYRKAFKDINRQISNLPDRSRKFYLKNLQKAIAEALTEISERAGIVIPNNMRLAAEQVLKETNKLPAALGMPVSANMAAISNSIVTNILAGNIYKEGWIFSGALWKDLKHKQGKINQTIAEGVIYNKSSAEIAQSLVKYLDPDVPMSKIAYRTETLARTLVSHAYQQAIVEASRHNPFCTGLRWMISNSGRVCPLCLAREGNIYPVNDVPLDHPRGMCTLEIVMEKNMTDIAVDIADWKQGNSNPALDNWAEYLNTGLTNGGNGSIIKAGSNKGADAVNETLIKARDINGYRQSPHNILSDGDIHHLIEEINAIEADSDVFKFNEGTATGYSERTNFINIKGDIFPDLSSKHPRDIMSERAVLAHEFYGHFKFYPSAFRPNDWRDEMRASYIAALKAPNLSDRDRAYLMLDAYERAKEAGHYFDYSKKAREIIYGYKN